MLFLSPKWMAQCVPMINTRVENDPHNKAVSDTMSDTACIMGEWEV